MFCRDKFNFLDELFIDCDLLFLQELWLYNNELFKLLNFGNGSSINMIATSAMDELVHRVSRPFSGCAII